MLPPAPTGIVLGSLPLKDLDQGLPGGFPVPAVPREVWRCLGISGREELLRVCSTSALCLLFLLHPQLTQHWGLQHCPDPESPKHPTLAFLCEILHFSLLWDKLAALARNLHQPQTIITGPGETCEPHPQEIGINSLHRGRFHPGKSKTALGSERRFLPPGKPSSPTAAAISVWDEQLGLGLIPASWAAPGGSCCPLTVIP